MKGIDEPEYERIPYVSILLYLLALFSKVEAVGALAIYFFYDVSQTARKSQYRKNKDKPEVYYGDSFFRDILRTLNKVTLRRISPFLLITLIYFIIRANLVESYVADARHNPSVTPLVYLYTQITAW